MDQNFGYVSFEPTFKIPKDFSNTVFVLLETTFTKKIQRDRTIFQEVKTPQKIQIGHFMNAESLRKTLKIFNFTATYVILMKGTTDIYLNKIFHFAECNS